MRVLHVSTSDIEGGSARSAWRIHSTLAERGVVSRMLVGFKSSDSADVDSIAALPGLQSADHWANRVSAKLGLQYCFLPSSVRVLRHPWVRDSDVVQLYNLHGGYFDLARLPALARRARIVWRLSDLWPLTGHCAYPGACERWRTGCGTCPDLQAYPGIGRDLTAFLWRRKRRIYRNIGQMIVVAPSSWTEASARNSPLLARFPLIRIPNGIDTKHFAPVDKDAARRSLGIDDDRPAIVFSAHVAFDNPRKGTDALEAALRGLPDPRAVCLIVAGRGAEHWIGRTPVDVHPLGFITDEARLAALYGAGDVVAIPSSVENLPNTALEALACARPVVAFDVGGMADAVRDGETGFCVPDGDCAAFGQALLLVLGDASLRARMGSAGRALILREFDRRLEAERFHNLYHSLLA